MRRQLVCQNHAVLSGSIKVHAQTTPGGEMRTNCAEWNGGAAQHNNLRVVRTCWFCRNTVQGGGDVGPSSAARKRQQTNMTCKCTADGTHDQRSTARCWASKEGISHSANFLVHSITERKYADTMVARKQRSNNNITGSVASPKISKQIMLKKYTS